MRADHERRLPHIYAPSVSVVRGRAPGALQSRAHSGWLGTVSIAHSGWVSMRRAPGARTRIELVDKQIRGYWMDGAGSTGLAARARGGSVGLGRRAPCVKPSPRQRQPPKPRREREVQQLLLCFWCWCVRSLRAMSVCRMALRCPLPSRVPRSSLARDPHWLLFSISMSRAADSNHPSIAGR